MHSNSRTSVSSTDIGKEVEHALRAATNVPETVKAEVDDHDVILSDQVQWDFERRAAKRAVQYLSGVTSVINRISLTPRASAVDAVDRIKAAIVRNAEIDAETIMVGVVGNKVTLTGTVRSFAEKRQAAHAAWSSLHVNEVDNRVQVRGV